MENYDEIVKLTLGGFCSTRDDVACMSVFSKPNQTCHMCGHHPITLNFVLYNLDTGEKMVVGSKCVTTYSRFAGRPLLFPQEFERAAALLNEKAPNAAVVAQGELLQTLHNLEDRRMPHLDEAQQSMRQMYDDLGLDPEAPDFFELAPDDLNPKYFDWESWDYEND
jgi:hypothetical protein